MNNIMKALNYQARRDNFTIYVILACVVVIGIFFFTSDIGKLNGSTATVNYGEYVSLVLMIVPLGITTRICGWDYADKTMNYEILSGHKRKDIYWSRFFVSMGWVTVIAYIAMVIPPVVFTVINGWGDNADLRNIIIRYVLVIFPLFRMVCELTLFTFILKNGYFSLLIGFILMEVISCISMFLDELEGIKTSFWITFSNLSGLVTFSNYSLGYVNGEDIYVYESVLEPSFIVGTIVVSLLVGIACLFGGYFYFKKCDIN